MGDVLDLSLLRKGHGAHQELGKDSTLGAGDRFEELQPSEEVRVLHQLAAIWRAGGRLHPSLYPQKQLEGGHVLVSRSCVAKLPLRDGALVDLQMFRKGRLG